MCNASRETWASGQERYREGKRKRASEWECSGVGERVSKKMKDCREREILRDRRKV